MRISTNKKVAGAIEKHPIAEPRPLAARGNRPRILKYAHGHIGGVVTAKQRQMRSALDRGAAQIDRSRGRQVESGKSASRRDESRVGDRKSTRLNSSHS